MNLLRTDHAVSIVLPASTGGGLLPIRQILGIGRNYAEHAKEQGAAVPDRPMVFTKSLASLCLTGDPIIIPKACQDQEQVDYEGELAFIIGRPTRDATEADARNPSSGIILGYCIANDVSARWWQKQGSGGQFYRGKSFDTFCPIGPRVVPADEIPDPMSLRLRTTLNTETVQDASTGDMIFSVFNLIADLSRGATLIPGTLVLTGTPSGVGMSRTPPRFLRAGDNLRIDIERLGHIENPVSVA
jgi:2-keto-4-pentenoate hydratase/2-oxohepta-3-ene-1,7-dioic acid hydratase in catechol pathway